MIGWVYLAVAIAANVASNMALKAGMTRVGPQLPGAGAGFGPKLLVFLGEPWLWLGTGLAGVLFACYLMALSHLPLTAAYTTVTVSATVSIAVVATLFGGESFNQFKLLGVILAVLSVISMTYGSSR